MAVRKKSKTATSGTGAKKVFSQFFLAIVFILCGGFVFNLDRISQNENFSSWMPEFITSWFSKSDSSNTSENVTNTDDIPDALPGEHLVKGKVISVYDGDTLTLVSGRGNAAKKYKVRFFGIDAPETKQPYGIESRDSLRDKVLNKEVTLEIVDTDRYGRSVGKIYLGSRYINREMVSEGSAWYYPDYAEHEKDLEVSQDLAKKNRAGLWQADNPQPPWLYRKEMRKR